MHPLKNAKKIQTVEGKNRTVEVMKIKIEQQRKQK